VGLVYQTQRPLSAKYIMVRIFGHTLRILGIRLDWIMGHTPHIGTLLIPHLVRDAHMYKLCIDSEGVS